MHTIKKLLIPVLIPSLIAISFTHAEDKKDSFWDKPANRAWVIAGASVGVAVLAMIAYGYKKKDVSLASASALPLVDKPAFRPMVILGEGNDIDLDNYVSGNRAVPMVVDLEQGIEWPAEKYDWQLDGDIQTLNDSIDSIGDTD